MVAQVKLWGGVLVLGGLMILGPGALPAKTEGREKPPAQGSDFHQFTAELRSIGALKFYEDTEDLLRTGKFERAFGRYVFLNSHIRGQALYTGLAAMVEQRLNFLKTQMRLSETTPHFVHVEPETRRPRIRRAATSPPEANSAAKKPAPDTEEKPPEIIIPPTVTPEQEKTPPPEEQKPSVEEAQTPPPPHSAWQKLKRRLKFW